MKAYTNNKDRVSAIIQIPELKKETHGRDYSEMLQARLTFDEALPEAARKSRALFDPALRHRLQLVSRQGEG